MECGIKGVDAKYETVGVELWYGGSGVWMSCKAWVSHLGQGEELGGLCGPMDGLRY